METRRAIDGARGVRPDSYTHEKYLNVDGRRNGLLRTAACTTDEITNMTSAIPGRLNTFEIFVSNNLCVCEKIISVLQ